MRKTFRIILIGIAVFFAPTLVLGLVIDHYLDLANPNRKLKKKTMYIATITLAIAIDLIRVVIMYL